MRTLIDGSHSYSEMVESIRETENLEATVYSAETAENDWGIIISDEADAPEGNVKLGTVALFRQLDSEDLDVVEAAKKTFLHHFVTLGIEMSVDDYGRNLLAAMTVDGLIREFGERVSKKIFQRGVN